MPRTPSVPLPPPEAASYEKQPGNTRQDLLAQTSNDSTPKLASKGPPISINTSSTSSSATLAPSAPASLNPVASTAPASVKRAPSTSAPSTPAVPVRAPSRAASIASEASHTSHKFTLKDLLAAGPKLSRRSSARSVSSRHSADSGSERSHGGKAKSARSGGGDSVGSLTQKYGVCQKIAIGKGATSVVRLAHKWDRSDGEKMYAVKEFRKRRRNETEKEYVKKLTAEFCISSTLHHVNIVETVDLVQDEQGRWCEVMEFCPGGDLYAAIKKGGMSPSEVECCFKQILQGVGYLHAQGVAHRDLKPENLFFDTYGHLKIGDYGASTVYRLPWEGTIHMSTGLCGSEPYIAPEQFLGKPYDARLVDIWACGIVYYCLHFQELPWRAAQQSDQLYATYAAAAAATTPPSLTTTAPGFTFPPTINNLSPRACRPLIRKMLEPDPTQRATIEDVLGCTWMQGVEVCWEVGELAKHVHVNARAMAAVVLGQPQER
ncbi:Pkinase-domain-containing protein [Mycena pura]|uniref:non-specific serine/threonine protein kinase n=1 Tax=Mycena pura TaxID=153505 RepID=A0AAD7E257_9AGAR|nr:Pkinase-domain-containing protein [Mycena pura]